MINGKLKFLNPVETSASGDNTYNGRNLYFFQGYSNALVTVDVTVVLTMRSVLLDMPLATGRSGIPGAHTGVMLDI